MNKDRVSALSLEINEDVKYAQEVSAKIVAKYSADIDNLMSEIQENVVNNVNQDDRLIEKYLLELVGALYVANTTIDSFSIYDDISKANATLAYSEKYAESQLKAATEGRKATQADHQQYAEVNSTDEKVLNLIYSKSVRILKNKIDGAYEMTDTLKRILKHHEQELFMEKQNRRLLESN